MTSQRLTLILAIVTSSLIPVLAQNLAADLQRAKQREASTGDCKSVLAEYARIVGQAAKTDRPVAAEALLRTGMCHEREGRVQDARVAYARVTSEFAVVNGSSDSTAARSAKEALTRLGVPVADGRGAAATQGVQPFKSVPMDTRVGSRDTASPDGRTIALVKDGMHLIERDVETQRERVLVALGEPSPGLTGSMAGLVSRDGRSFATVIGFCTCVWSPDGSELAFSLQIRDTAALAQRQVNSDQLRSVVQIVSRASGAVRTVAETTPGVLATVARWVNSGVLYQTWPIVRQGPTVHDFLIAPIQGGVSRTILRGLPAINEGPLRALVFGDVTPDGTSAIVVRSESLAMIDLATGVERSISLAIGAASPRISPDGRLVAFVSRQTGSSALYVAPLDRLPIRNPVRVAELSSSDVAQGVPRWMLDDTLRLDLAVNETNLFRVDVDPATGRPLGVPERLTREIPGSRPVVSPDGKQVAYTAADGGVIVMNADGGGARRLTAPGRPTHANSARGWRSVDEVLFVSGAAPGPDAGMIRVVNTRTGAIAVLPHSIPNATVATWKYVIARNEIYYRNPNPEHTIVARSLVDGREREVFRQPGLGSWSVSGDGAWISYTMATADREKSEFRVQALPADGQPPAPILTDRMAALPVAEGWDPRGLFAAFVSTEGVRIVDVGTRESWPLFDNRSGRTFLDRDVTSSWGLDLGWAPDGSFVIPVIDTTQRRRLAFEGVTYQAVTRLMNSR